MNGNCVECDREIGWENMPFMLCEECKNEKV